MIDEQVKELKKEYIRLGHALQFGVHFDQDTSDQTPKHLRVGVNMSLVNSSALACLLIQKGIITEVEYWSSMVEVLREEIESYRQKTPRHSGEAVMIPDPSPRAKELAKALGEIELPLWVQFLTSISQRDYIEEQAAIMIEKAFQGVRDESRLA